MRRQNQLTIIKNYSMHLKKLINIKNRSNSKEHIERSIEALTISNAKTSRSRRCETENTRKKEQGIHHHHLPLNLPLVGMTERQLLSKSLSVRKIPQREAQIVLQNYLLSKRLLKAKPSINKTNLDKDYEKHERYSNLRSKSKQQEIKLSQSRLLKFKEFQICQRRKISSRVNHSTLGAGKYLFTLKITSFQRIHKKQDKQSLYNLVLRLGKRSFTYKHLSLRGLAEGVYFNFRKSELKFPAILYGEFEEIVQNDCRKIGNCSIDLNEAYQKLKTIEKHSGFTYERREEVQGIRTARSELLVGTIAFSYSITKQTQ